MSLNTVQLGRTGIHVTELCFGTLVLGKLQADLSPDEGGKAIRRAAELGINFFDTAKGYKTYEHTRIGLEGYENMIIASKSPVSDSDEMRTDVETCLRELDREMIDIFHLHLIRTKQDMMNREGALDTLVKCREEGKIRSVGLTAHGPEGVLCALDYDEIDVVMPLLNKEGLGIIGATQQEMVDAVRKVYDSGRGVYAMKPLGGGHLIKDMPGAIQYLRDLMMFHSISVGLKTPEEVEIMSGVFQNDAKAIERSYIMGKNRANKKKLLVYDFLCEKCGTCVDECAQNAISIGEKCAVVDPDLCILCGYCAASCPKFAIRVV
ncbi:MAG: aldo/keto reductase [Candidatus Latescibacteria bacterium]|nr:aldo/keto reductase [Candidatus Latescibacterota bacterium]